MQVKLSIMLHMRLKKKVRIALLAHVTILVLDQFKNACSKLSMAGLKSVASQLGCGKGEGVCLLSV